jgi:hypothetical protein
MESLSIIAMRAAWNLKLRRQSRQLFTLDRTNVRRKQRSQPPGNPRRRASIALGFDEARLPVVCLGLALRSDRHRGDRARLSQFEWAPLMAAFFLAMLLI